MSTELTVILLLSCLVIVQHIYWSRIVNGLIDRLMSKNHFEYAQGQRHLKDKPPKTHLALQDEVIDPESDRQAQELNSLFPMV